MTNATRPFLNRRGFMAGALAAATVPAVAARAQTPAVPELRTGISRQQLLPPQYGETEVWGYNGGAPGPEIRLAQGARLQRTLVNDLPAPTSIHWHGIRLPNGMDGVSGLTQDPVASGEAFDYDFTVPDAGTYWYHAHYRSIEQVARGLYGPLIVEEADAIDIDQEEVLLLDDWLVDPKTAQIDSDFEALHDRSHAGRNGNYVVTNGTFGLTKQVQQNNRLRLRLINAANARIFELRFAGLDGWVVALDGMPLASPEPLTEYLLLSPAQRADVIVDVTAAPSDAAGVFVVLDQQTIPQVIFDVTGIGSQSRRPAPLALPPNGHSMVSLADTERRELRMEGGAMGGLRSATLGGETMGFRQLASSGQFWAFNGAIGRMEDDPLLRIERGTHVRLAIKNDTAFPHAMHLHGMHFHEIADDGSIGPLRDTTLLFGDQTRDIAFVADNPGTWLLHCHMLAHAASGMTTKIEVV